MTKAVVLLSGGIDSSTCLAQAVGTYGAAEVVAVTIFYGQKHERELRSADAVANFYRVRHIVKDLSGIFELSDSPLLAANHGEIPKGSYADKSTHEADGLSKTYVPFRNGLFLSYVAAIAYSLGAKYILYGAHADDAAGNAYPDCSPEFYRHMAEAINLGTGKKVQLSAPLIHFNKTDVVSLGLDLKVPYGLTWSCYNGGEAACGVCPTCLDRLEAFEANRVVDPIIYRVEQE